MINVGLGPVVNGQLRESLERREVPALGKRLARPLTLRGLASSYQAGELMAKKIDGYINLQVPAGAANPSPPIGPALGQRGVNIMEFCKSFNAKTKDLEQGTPIPVKITVYSDRSFTFEMRTPPATYLIKKAVGMKPTGKPGSGSKAPGRDIVGSITMAQLREIAKLKLKDMNTDDVDQAARTIAGSARSMGLRVEE